MVPKARGDRRPSVPLRLYVRHAHGGADPVRFFHSTYKRCKYHKAHPKVLWLTGKRLICLAWHRVHGEPELSYSVHITASRDSDRERQIEDSTGSANISAG